LVCVCLCVTAFVCSRTRLRFGWMSIKLGLLHRDGHQYYCIALFCGFNLPLIIYCDLRMNSRRVRLVHLDSNFCSGNNDGLYMVPNNCTAYYRCANGKTYIHHCPPGLIFSGRFKRCFPYFRVPERAEECIVSLRYFSSLIYLLLL